MYSYLYLLCRHMRKEVHINSLYIIYDNNKKKETQYPTRFPHDIPLPPSYTYYMLAILVRDYYGATHAIGIFIFQT